MNILINTGNEVIIKMLESKNGYVIEKDVAVVDVDYSLIRYLAKQVCYREISINNYGYAITKREDNTTTTLHRLILEYYSNTNDNLKEILNNKEFEINHKNKNKLDNKLCNLEIVTHQNNIRHSKGLEYEVIMTSGELKNIQQNNLEDKQQIIDKEYLSRISGVFYKSMNSNSINEKIVQCSYIYYKFKYSNNIKETSSDQSSYQRNSTTSKPPKFLSNFHTKSIYLLLQHHKEYIYKSIIKSNIALLNRNIHRYPSIKEILSKYNIYNRNSNYSSILLQLYEHLYRTSKYIIKNGNILFTLSIRSHFKVKGRYKAFIILYLLGILQRTTLQQQPSSNDRYKRIPSSICITPLTEDDFKQINTKAKKLLSLNWNSIRYFTVAEEFGPDVADEIYNNENCKLHYNYSLRAKEDIITMLKNDQAVFLEGFITKNKIFVYVKALNTNRQQNGAKYNKITNKFYSFISSLLLYNTEIKSILEEKGLIYTTLNTQIINNITQHQAKNGIGNTSHILKPKMKAIILKSLQ
mgnify:CR=1 FL=1